MFLYLLVIFFLTYIVIIINVKHRNRKQGLHPPGPLGLPFIGNLHQFDTANPHLYLWKLSLKYGHLAHLKHGFVPIIVVSSAKMAKEFLQTHDLEFCTRPPVVGQQKLSYNGIDIAFSPYNEHWKKMRKICIHHLFNPKQVLSFRPIRENEVSHMVNKISQLASSSQLANISEIAMSLASNLICRVAFGRRYDDEECEKRRFDRLLVVAQELMVGFYFSDYFPPFGWLDKFTKKSARLEKHCKELDMFYRELIDEHLNPSRPKSYEDDFLGRMLKLEQDQEKSSSSIFLTRDHIKALLMNLFVAGADTVAAGIVWAMTALMMRPSIMKTAQSEIRDIIGEKGTVNEEDLNKLPYLKAVVMETLRLYPPAPLLFRKQTNDSTLGQYSGAKTINGYKIEQGSLVVINGWAISRDPETWKDPHTFRPERFLDNENSRKVVDFVMIPFGGGRRGCPGGSMGLTAVELALANLLYHFDWEFPCGVKEMNIDALPGLTMHKKNALILVPKLT